MRQKQFLAILTAFAVLSGFAGCQGDIAEEPVNTEHTTHITTMREQINDPETELFQTETGGNDVDPENNISIVTESYPNDEYLSEPIDKQIKLNGKDHDIGAEELILYEISNEDIRKLPLFYDLKSLSINIPPENEPVDLSPLSELSSLKYLAVHGTYTDFSFLDGMSNLEEMYIYGFDCETLENFPINRSLISFQCDYCNFSDISWLSNLKSLKCLTLGETICENYAPIGNISSLEDFRMGIESNYTVDFSFLKNLTGLKNFDYNDFSSKGADVNFAEIANCTELENVYIYGKIDNIEFCRSMKKLKEFSFQGGGETFDISPLCDCHEIEKISLFCNFEMEDYEKLKSTLQDCEITSHLDL